jgi:hypothetical protein
MQRTYPGSYPERLPHAFRQSSDRGALRLTTFLLNFLSIISPLLLQTEAWPKSIDYSSLKVSEEIWIDIEDAHPTQFRVGKIEVEDRTHTFIKKGVEKLREYLRKHPCRAVIGPEGKIYITDMHHRAFAAYNAELAFHAKALSETSQRPQIYVHIIDNLSHLSSEDFEKEMIAKRYTYLKDRGILRRFSELSRYIFQLKDDPYRTVAGYLEDIGWKFPEEADFEQFTIDEWLRENMQLPDHVVKKELKKNKLKFLQKALEVLRSPEAKSEPWYVDSTHCTINVLTKSFIKDRF